MAVLPSLLLLSLIWNMWPCWSDDKEVNWVFIKYFSFSLYLYLSFFFVFLFQCTCICICLFGIVIFIPHLAHWKHVAVLIRWQGGKLGFYPVNYSAQQRNIASLALRNTISPLNQSHPRPLRDKSIIFVHANNGPDFQIVSASRHCLTCMAVGL